MFTTAAVRNNIRQNNLDQIYQSIQTGQNEGMQTMDMAVARLVKERRVSYDVALPYLRDESTRRALAPFANAHGGGEPNAGVGRQDQTLPSRGVPEPAPVAPAAVAEPERPRRGILGGMAIPPWEKK